MIISICKQAYKHTGSALILLYSVTVFLNTIELIRMYSTSTDGILEDRALQNAFDVLFNATPPILHFSMVFIYYYYYYSQYPNSISNRMRKWIDRNVISYMWLIFGLMVYGPMILFRLIARLRCDFGDKCRPNEVPSLTEILIFGIYFVACIAIHCYTVFTKQHNNNSDCKNVVVNMINKMSFDEKNIKVKFNKYKILFFFYFLLFTFYYYSSSSYSSEQRHCCCY